MGCSVMQYATDWRMNLACRLLADDGLSLAEAAQRVGYENIPAFSRSFKAAWEWRRGVAAQQRGLGVFRAEVPPRIWRPPCRRPVLR